MCMYKEEEETKAFLKKHKGQKEVVVWKLYRVYNDSDRVYPPHRCCGGVTGGVIKSDRRRKSKDKDDEYGGTYINRGIHVYTTRGEARYHQRGYGNGSTRVFKCTAKLKDLVGVNAHSRHAVFMKIHITPEEFEKGKKGRN